MTAPDHQSRGHAPYAPSSAERWLTCTGCIPLELEMRANNEIQEPETIPTQSGTAMHERSEVHLLKWTDVEDDTETLTYTVEGEEHTIAFEEWHPHVCGYVAAIRACYRELADLYGEENVVLSVEERVDIIGADCFGTLDCAVYVIGEELHLWDLKTGAGHIVMSKENPQFMAYAVGMCKKHNWDFGTVTLNRWQAPHEGHQHDGWTCSIEQIKEFEKYAKKQIRESKTGKKKFVIGDHCTWCKAKPRCPASREQTLSLFDDEGEPATNIEALSPDAVEFIVRYGNRLKDYIDSVIGFATERVHGGDEDILPGYKVVEGRSVRAWVDELSEDDIIQEVEMLGAEATETKTKLRAFSKIEKELGKGSIDHLLVKKKGKPTLVPETDKRPAIVKKDIFDDEHES